jgi:hypothetical protein
VWLHEQVLEALMRRHAVLPLRFGTLVPDAEMLRNRLAAMLPALGDDLRRLRGRVEFALRVTGVDAECLRAGDAAETSDAARTLSPGTRYLRARAERTERALRQHLDPTAESAAWGLAAARSTTLVASYLVPRKDASAFAAAVADVRAHHPALKISCTGPWAPYSFVTVRPPKA